MAPTSSLSPATFLLVSAAVLPMALAHDHDSSHIEDGMAISVDPIVRLLARAIAGNCRIGCMRMTRDLTILT